MIRLSAQFERRGDRQGRRVRRLVIGIGGRFMLMVQWAGPWATLFCALYTLTH